MREPVYPSYRACRLITDSFCCTACVLLLNVGGIGLSTLNNAALMYAEKYGIRKYRVSGKYLVYFRNYRNTEFKHGAWRRCDRSYKYTVDLETMKIRSEQLPEIVQEGWLNV